MQRSQLPTLVNLFVEQFIPIPRSATFRLSLGPYSIAWSMENVSKRDMLLFYLRYPFLYNIILIFILILLTWLWPSVLPFGLFAFWTLHGFISLLLALSLILSLLANYTRFCFILGGDGL